MKSRIKITEITTLRVVNAIKRRITQIPRKINWSYGITGKKERARLNGFKNIYTGHRCYLIANGSSLNKTDLSNMKNKITFGLNRIYLNFENMGFETSYLIAINQLVLEQFTEEISDLKMPKFINWSAYNIYKNDPNSHFIGKSLFGKQFGGNEIHKSLNAAATVTYAALQIIYYMGFNEVIIIGMDHNFDTKGNPNKKETRTQEKDENHFHPNYFPKGSSWETPDLRSSEYYYKIANNMFKKDNRSIIDCTIGGKCNVFQKGDIKNFI